MHLITMLLTVWIAAQTAGPAGVWTGSIKIPGMPLEVMVTLASVDGVWTGTIDIPAQGAAGLALEKIEIQPPKVSFAIKGVPGSPTFTGTLSEDGRTIDGTFTQGSGSVPFSLTRSADAKAAAAAMKPKRPQEPVPPLPYDEEEVVYNNGDITLAGTLTHPRGGGRFPAVVLITGSGAEDRDETVFGHKPFLILADYLTRQGIAVLRSDDRGVGGSTGRVDTSTSDDFANDALAAVRTLKARKDIDGAHIGLIGHSEGGIVAPIAANRSSDVAFIVMMAGPGLPGEDILYLQGAAIAKAGGATDAAIAANRATQEKIFAILKAVDDPKAREEQIRAVAPRQAAGVLSPWFRYFLTYDPRPALRALKCPALALIGEHDLQVPYRENIAAIQAALDAGGNRDHTVEVLPRLNHLFQTSDTGSPAEYMKVEETMSPDALRKIGEWIKERSGRS